MANQADLLRIDGVVAAGELHLVGIGGNTGVFVETAKTGFNRLHAALVGGG
jgi:roadblock/LC7 domain-containing protein